MTLHLPVGLAILLASSAALAAPAERPLGEIYRTLHAHPELSHHEEQTSALLAAELRQAGYAVTDHLGLYPDGSHAFGVVAILKNGPGPTLLIRADMDALPVVEETGLPYASTVVVKDAAGQSVGVMHACGHDIHVTTLIGVARALAAAKASWHGTVMLVGQPSEETIDGAKALLADHLYERFGRPDMIVGLHDINTLPAGKVGIPIGPAQAGSTSVDVVVHGIGGHGAMPQLGKDPIVIAAELIVQLQTIVSRQEDAFDPAVVTVGSIHGGTKRNIIPDEVKLQLTLRAFSEKAMGIAVEGVRHAALGAAVAAGLPPEKAPTVTVLEHESTPPLINDVALATRVRGILVDTLGADQVTTLPPIMPSEDVGVYGLDGHQIPVAYYFLGAINPDQFAAITAKGRQPPGLHTSRFAPDPAPTLTTGVRAMTAVAVALLQPGKP